MKNSARYLLGCFLMCLVAVAGSTDTRAAEAGRPVEAMEWSFQGPFGTYDRNALRRGFQVYREVCAACHGLDLIAFRNLSQEGGPEFTEAQVKVLAAEYVVVDGPDDIGEMFERAGEAKDRIPNPYANDNAARAANGGAYPPDLSLITKARAGGADYLYALLTGYMDPPDGVELRAGLYYNPYMAGGKIAMPPPLVEDIVEYGDSTPATISQMARDVTYFLSWTAEPELETRKRIGVMTMIYLLILTGLLYFSMRKVWADKH